MPIIHTANTRRKLVLIGLALLGLIASGLVGVQWQKNHEPTPERFVQVNGYGQWRGFEVAGDSVQWVGGCSIGEVIKRGATERAGLSLQYFTRESPLIYMHPSLGEFAAVDDFSPAQINHADANMRLILKRWNKDGEGDRLTNCPKAHQS